MRNRSDERREFQRLELRELIAARLGDVEVLIVDLGVLGARIEVAVSLEEGVSAVLRFADGAREIAFDCTVIRVTEGTAMTTKRYEAGLRFLEAIENSDDGVRGLLTRLVTEEIERARSVLPPPHATAFDGDATAMRIPAPFISFRFEDGSWRRRGIFVPEQPPAGFTVPDGEDAVELQQLCLSYELGDGEERRMIRLFAELRICRALGIPPRKS